MKKYKLNLKINLPMGGFWEENQTVDEESIDKYFSANTKEGLILGGYLELIETPKMEVVEGICENNSHEFYPFVKNTIKGKTPAIIVTNPPKFLSELLRKIEAGECYERWVENEVVRDKKFSNTAFYSTPMINGCKLLIIPITEANNE